MVAGHYIHIRMEACYVGFPDGDKLMVILILDIIRRCHKFIDDELTQVISWNQAKHRRVQHTYTYIRYLYILLRQALVFEKKDLNMTTISPEKYG